MVNRGHDLEKIINANHTDKIFYTLCKEKYFLEQRDRDEVIHGGGK